MSVPVLSEGRSTVRGVAVEQSSETRPASRSGSRKGSHSRSHSGSRTKRADGEERRCGWCSNVLPTQESVGRPRLYCGQACRQRAYEQRTTAARAGLAPDVVVVKRAELDGLQDRLFQLRCAIEDVQTLLSEKPTKAELERSLAELVRSTGRLDRLWVSERELSMAARSALAG